MSGNETLSHFDKVLVHRVRKAAPAAILADILGVQPMTGPTASIFALRTRYGIWDDLPGCRCDDVMSYTFDYFIDFDLDHAVVNDPAMMREVLAWPTTNCRGAFNYGRVAHSATIPKEGSEIRWVWRWSFESPEEAFAFKIRWG